MAIKKISKIIGAMTALTVNSSLHLIHEFKNNAREGYNEKKKFRCTWCQGYFRLAELKKVCDEEFSLCGDCLEGLTVLEGVMSSQHIPQEEQSERIRALLTDVDKKGKSKGSFFFREPTIKFYKQLPKKKAKNK